MDYELAKKAQIEAEKLAEERGTHWSMCLDEAYEKITGIQMPVKHNRG